MAGAAVQSEWMAGLCLPMTTSCLPTALILHRGHWSGSYWFFLSFFALSLLLSFCLYSSFSSFPYLSLSQICLPWPRRSSLRPWLVTTAANNMAGQTERTVTTTPDWVSPINKYTDVHTHTHACIWNVEWRSCRCRLFTSAMPSQFDFSSCVFVRLLIKTRMWHHLCCLHVSFERHWMKNKLPQQWVSSSDGIFQVVINVCNEWTFTLAKELFAYLWNSPRFRKCILKNTVGHQLCGLRILPSDHSDILVITRGERGAKPAQLLKLNVALGLLHQIKLPQGLLDERLGFSELNASCALIYS